jgi:hypothetical protein
MDINNLRVAGQDELEAMQQWLKTVEDVRDQSHYRRSLWERSVWILHAAYENPLLPTTTVVEEEPFFINGEDITKVGTATNIPLGWVEHPGAGWRRLTWREQAERAGIQLGAGQKWPPSFRWAPDHLSGNIQGAPEGSLDLETYCFFLSQAMRVTQSECVAYQDSLFDPPVAYVGALLDFPTLLNEYQFSPTYIFPVNHEWCLWTDTDLSGTLVCGDTSFIEALEADPELETLVWPFDDASAETG